MAGIDLKTNELPEIAHRDRFITLYGGFPRRLCFDIEKLIVIWVGGRGFRVYDCLLCGARSDGRGDRHLLIKAEAPRWVHACVLGQPLTPQPREFRSKSLVFRHLRRMCCGDARSIMSRVSEPTDLTVRIPAKPLALHRQELKRHAADNRCKALGWDASHRRQSLPHGVMVAQLVLIQPVQVQILVG